MLLLELQKVMNWKMQAKIGLAQTFGGFWIWEKTSSCLLHYLIIQRNAVCEAYLNIQDFSLFNDILN